MNSGYYEGAGTWADEMGVEQAKDVSASRCRAKRSVQKRDKHAARGIAFLPRIAKT